MGGHALCRLRGLCSLRRLHGFHRSVGVALRLQGSIAAIVALAAALGLPAAHAADGDFTPVPALRAHVTDLTGTLSSPEKSALEQKLAAWEAQKGGQFAVLMVPTTKPEPIDQYSQRVTDQWLLGRKGVDDGILLLIAKDDKKLRIQVGKGFEGALTDVTAKRIIEEDIVPPLRRGDFVGGINAGVDRVFAVVAGETLPPPRAAQANRTTSHSGGWFNDWIGFILFAGLGLFWLAASLLNRMFGRIGGSLVGGAVAGGIGWLLTSLIAVAAGAGIVAFIVLLIALAARGAGVGAGQHSGFGGGSGGGGFGGSSSGSSAGSSWSGGGGDFGGGGASGSWGSSDS